MRPYAMLATLAIALLSAALPAAAANTFSADASDMWWKPDESGWGVNVVQQGNVIFATLYVYAADGTAHWFVAPDMEAPGGSPLTFTGDLYETTGPAFTASFNPGAVTRRVVGTATFTYSASNSAAFAYSVDGKSVARNIQRMTWRSPDLSGEYEVWRNIRSSNCTDMGNSSYDYIIQQSGNAVTIQAYQGVALQCSWSGTVSQAGRMSAITASGTCGGTPSTSSLRIDDLEVGVNGFMGHLASTEHGCDLFGRIAGVNTSPPTS